MIPNIFMHEQLTFGGVRERQREVEHERMLSRLRKGRQGWIQRLIGSLGTFLVTPGISMKQLSRAVNTQFEGVRETHIAMKNKVHKSRISQREL